VRGGEELTTPLDVRIERGDGTAKVAVAGEVDLANADRLREALRSALEEARMVLVDLEACTFIDSVGLSVLVEAARGGEGADEVLCIVSPSAAVRRLIELTQLETLIPVFDSEADATARLAASEATSE
jgi:anti-sigma B factor antagonist